MWASADAVSWKVIKESKKLVKHSVYGLFCFLSLYQIMSNVGWKIRGQEENFDLSRSNSLIRGVKKHCFLDIKREKNGTQNQHSFLCMNKGKKQQQSSAPLHAYQL